MSAKKLLVAALMTSLLTACGSGQLNQAPLPVDGGYDSEPLSGSSDEDASNVVKPDPEPTASPATEAATEKSFTLKGIVTDQSTGNALKKAKVSIAGRTMLTDDKGSFEFTGITDNKVWVDVTLDGYDPISQFDVTFSDEQPTADKAFKLSTSGSGTGNTTPSTTTGLSHGAEYGTKLFKSVSAMVVSDDVIYVLGVRDGFLWFDRNSIVALQAGDGGELATMNKVGTVSYLPKDATSLKVSGDAITASSAKASYSFSKGGAFQQKSTAVTAGLIKEVKDTDRNITYTLKSTTKITINVKGTAKDYTLDEVSTAKALGLDSDGHLLVLDDAHKTVHEFTFTP